MSDVTLHVKTFVLGAWMTNCHIVHVGDEKQCWIVDAGFEPGELIDCIKQHQLDPIAVVLTHAHIDHIAGLHEVRKHWPTVPIWIHEAERQFLIDPILNLSIALADPFVGPEADDVLQHGQTLELSGLKFEIRHTPGHSPGGISLYEPENGLAIVGDTLFVGSIGRTDFPTSDHNLLIRSIHEQLMTLSDDTVALPGHGPSTTIGDVRETNPFLQ